MTKPAPRSMSARAWERLVRLFCGDELADQARRPPDGR
jgi:hypothetical protein